MFNKIARKYFIARITAMVIILVTIVTYMAGSYINNTYFDAHIDGEGALLIYEALTIEVYIVWWIIDKVIILARKIRDKVKSKRIKITTV